MMREGGLIKEESILTEELKAKLEGKSLEEIRELAKEGSLPLTEDELDSIAGGGTFWESLKWAFGSSTNKCPRCKHYFDVEEEKDWQKCPGCGHVFIKLK